MKPDTTENKIAFIRKYMKAQNAATGSDVDQNANVSNKNVATMAAELPKKDIIALNRELMRQKLTSMYGAELADQYEKDLAHHIIYKHDETSIFPYCCSISLYPFLLDGLTKIGGSSTAPQHLDSFCGSFINLIFLVAGQFAGATATPEFLTYFDHFARKDYGENYIERLDEIVEMTARPSTLRDKLEHYFAQVTYTLNQPAGARGYQSIFWNIAYFDRDYFNSIFKDFVFPDGDEPCWETTKELQKLFMKWFNAERLKNILTFPVETVNMHTVDGQYSDSETADFMAEMWAEGASFFMYQSDSVDSLSSCCRLRNGIEDNTFSYTLGAGGIETGSKGVITLNLNRIVQDWDRMNKQALVPAEEWLLSEYIASIVNRVHKYLTAFNEIIWDSKNAGLLTIFNAGFIDLDRQYLTIGINGFVEGAEYLGIPIDADSSEYQLYAKNILETIKNLNIAARTDRCKFNTEFVPAESLGVKNAKWDKKDGYAVPRDCYNSYFYIVEDESVDPVKKFRFQGIKFTGCCDGGSALHNNLDEHLSARQYRMLMDVAVKEGCNYFTYNVMNTICNHCGYISKHTLDVCPKCGSTDIDYATRIIGYLKRVSAFSAARQIEADNRAYGKVRD